MNGIQVFENSEFGKVRTALLNDEPMFCLGDVCKALGIAQASKVKERLSEKGVHSIPTLTAGGKQRLLYINESNLYKAIFHSRKESAERFTDWVTSEVLPSILIGELAKLLKQNGVETGQRRLFTWMRDNGYLIKGGSSRNMPTQKGMELGLFEIKETTINNPDGSIRISRTTKVTGKGQQYFINKFLAA